MQRVPQQQPTRHTANYMLGFLLGMLLLGVAVRVSHAQDAPGEQRFHAGNEAYAQGEYEEAIAAYRDVLEAGYVSGALYYNLGNAYYRAGQVGQAIRYYEKARQLIPQNPRLLHSLEVVRDQIGADVPTRTQPGGFVVLAQQIPVTGLLIVGLLLYAVGVVVWAYRRWAAPGLRAPYQYGSIGALAFGLFLVVVALTASYMQTLDRRAIIITPSASLHEAPQAGAPADTTLREGYMVRIQRKRRGWTRVELPGGTVGWIAEENIGEV